MNPFKASISFENIAQSSSSEMLHCKLNHMRNEPHFIENKFNILIIVKRLREKVREKNIIRMLFIILITAEGNKFFPVSMNAFATTRSGIAIARPNGRTFT